MIVNHMGVNNKQAENFVLHRPGGSEDYLFVLFKSPSKVFVSGEYVKTNYGDWIIFNKNSIQSYYPTEGEFLHDFIHFDFESEHERVILEGIPLNQLISSDRTEELSAVLEAISLEYYSVSSYKKEIVNYFLHAFLLKLKNEDIINKKPYYGAMVELREKIYTNPQNEWKVDEMSDEIHISTSYFQALYKKYFGISCINEVVKARISAAKRFLAHSEMTVGEIAYSCGYNNTEHFIRQFKQYEKLTPMQFKKNRNI